jgi:hypothetical protein
MKPCTSILVAAAALVPPAVPGTLAEPVVVLRREARDSMSAVYRTYNRHWDQLADLNMLEKMLATVRPTQREYLGCMLGRVEGRVIHVDRWVPAKHMKQLPLAVSGSCDSIPGVVGTWHTHPYRADLENQPVKERSLSRQDVATFAETAWAVTLVMWDEDSVDAAARDAGGTIRHPVAVRIE